jgi:hypothetical protein
LEPHRFSYFHLPQAVGWQPTNDKHARDKMLLEKRFSHLIRILMKAQDENEKWEALLCQ